MKKSQVVIAGLVLFLGGSVCTAAYGQKPKVIKEKPAPAAKVPVAPAVEPDKLLYDKGVDFLKHGHYTEARLDFQTLINTYPDSEYLAKAKLGSADSFYKEGGTSSMIQAIAEYKDFITFFPFLDESAYAQMQVGMGHYRMMEKADRDNSQAEAAEQEFQTFLLKYPQSPLAPKAEQYLRDVQEVMADGEFKIGRFYYLRSRQYPQDYSAATARLMEVSERYPLYSDADEALWMLADVYMRAKQFSKNEDDKNHWADLAGKCYDRILTNYPLSRWAPSSKSQLTGMGMAVPAAYPAAIDRMKQEQAYYKQHHSTRSSLMSMPIGMMKSNPDTSLAARAGTPTLSVPDEVVSATDVLKTGAAGPSFSLAARMPADSATNGAEGESTTPVDAVRSASTGGGTGIGAEIISAPSSASKDGIITNDALPSAGSSSSSSSNTPGAGSDSTTAAPAATDSNASSVAPTAGSGTSGDTTSGDSQSGANQQPAPKSDSSTESTSKKKKGIKKIIPF